MEETRWYNPPHRWQIEGTRIHVTAGAKTDFWRKTHYGFIRDNGHFYYREVVGDFTVSVKVMGQYQTLYDQAGLMIRENENTWIKFGIEFVGEVQNVSAVVTRDYSDWSLVSLVNPPDCLWLRIKRRSGAIESEYSLDGENYSLLRLAYLTEAPIVQVGIMCAAPEGNGFDVEFEGLEIITGDSEKSTVF